MGRASKMKAKNRIFAPVRPLIIIIRSLTFRLFDYFDQKVLFVNNLPIQQVVGGREPPL